MISPSAHSKPDRWIPRLVLVCLGCLWSFGAQTAGGASGATERLQTMGTVTVGNALPAFSGWTPNAEMILSRELMRPTKGAPPAALVVSLFAEWCLSCREGLPIINELIRNRPDAAAVLIALPPNLNKVPKFLQDLQVDIPVIKDPYFKISGERFGLSVGNGMLSETLPRTIVVNQSGVVQAIFGTEGDDFKRVLTEALDRAASQAKTRPKQ